MSFFFRLLCLVVMITFCYGCGSSSPPVRKAEGRMAPDFQLPVLDGQPGQQIKLSEIMQEHVVLLAFWATWCPGCVSEVPTLKAWHSRYYDRGLRIYGLNMEEPDEVVRSFVRKHAIEYPILLDRKGEVAYQYGIVGLPVTVVLAKGGKILYYGFSLPDMEELLPPTSTTVAEGV